MLLRFAAIASTLLLCSMTVAQEMKEVVDDRGRTLVVPAKPERIVSLFDGLITVPLVEIGAPVVGSIGDIDLATGQWRIFGLQDLLDLSPGDIDIQNIGQYAALDIEAIQALEPDLIIADESRGAEIKRLEFIAPVFVQEVYSGAAYGVSPQKDMAALVGRLDRYNQLEARYKERVRSIKARLNGQKSVSAVIVWDQLTPMWPVNGLTQALQDLGLELTPITSGNGSNNIPISPEAFPQL
ncbi:MAG: ABC transporter substrate-binding protein, partial [Pseudomonadota bacterium]